MRFPERSRRGDPAHTKAIEQLDEARVTQDRLTALADAAEGTQREAEIADARDDARDRFAAKEAWLIWIERGSSTAPDGTSMRPRHSHARWPLVPE